MLVTVLLADLSAVSPIENLLIQALGLGQWLRAKLLGQNLLTVAVLGQRQIGAPILHQVFHQHIVRILPARIENQGFATNVYRLSILVQFCVAFCGPGQHLQIKFMKPLPLFGTPIGVNLFLQVIAPVETSGLDIAVQGKEEEYFQDLMEMREFLGRVSGVAGPPLTVQPLRDATKSVTNMKQKD